MGESAVSTRLRPLTGQFEAVDALSSALRVQFQTVDDRGDFVLIASGGDRGLLVSADSRHARARAFNRVSNGHSIMRKIGSAMVGASLRIGALGGLAHRPQFAVQSGGDSIFDHLRNQVDMSVDFLVSVGPPRPNRKPVIELVDRAGHSVGFAKVGWNEVTSRLVTHEADFLEDHQRFARASALDAPRVLHRGRWSGLEIALFSALSPSWKAFVSSPTPGSEVIAQIADIGGERRVTTLAESGVLERLRSKIDGLVDGPHDGAHLAIDRLSDGYGDTSVAIGNWHGDFGPWNMAPRGQGGFQVWDWERAGDDQVVGLDLVHYHFQNAFASTKKLDRALQSAIGDSWGAIQRLQDSPVARRAVEVLYLVERYARYWEPGTVTPRPPIQEQIGRRLAG